MIRISNRKKYNVSNEQMEKVEYALFKGDKLKNVTEESLTKYFQEKDRFLITKEVQGRAIFYVVSTKDLTSEFLSNVRNAIPNKHVIQALVKSINSGQFVKHSAGEFSNIYTSYINDYLGK